MFKFVKILLIAAYTILLFQFISKSLHSVIQDIELEYLVNMPNSIQKREVNSKSEFSVHKKVKRFSSDLKYILKYTNSFLHYGTLMYKNGQRAFIDSNCTYYNCYITNMQNTLLDFRDYDAVLFDVENSWDTPVTIREPYQKFIFMASESAANYPLCDNFYDFHYNLSWTYKLDSDIRWTYLNIEDLEGNTVGPKINMTWIDSDKPTPIEVKKKLGGKKKAAAWFVSHCTAISGRQNVTRQIEKALKKYNLTIDIYGWCGRLSCPRDNMEDCLYLLETDYYFYLSFENSLSEDYVTEKVLYPLQNYAVPVVFGGADYSRFLPPGSYINAMELNATQIADQMYKAIQNPDVYENYFRWHNHYKYVKAAKEPDLCKLCQILNLEADKRFVYKNFRYWWNPDYPSLCKKGVGRFLIRKPEEDIALDDHEFNQNFTRKIDDS